MFDDEVEVILDQLINLVTDISKNENTALIKHPESITLILRTEVSKFPLEFKFDLKKSSSELVRIFFSISTIGFLVS